MKNKLLKPVHRILWLFLCVSNGLLAQTVSQADLKMVSKNQVLLEKIDLKAGENTTEVNTNVYVSYRSGNAQKFWTNLAIATAGVAVSTQLQNGNTLESNASPISPVLPLGVSLATLPGIWKNRPRAVPDAQLEIQHKSSDGTILDIWTQPISKAARNNAELLSIKIDKSLKDGTLEVYLKNDSRNNVYYWGQQTTQKSIASELPVLVTEPLGKDKLSPTKVPKGFISNGKGLFYDAENPSLVVDEKNANTIAGIRATVALENLRNPNLKKIVKDFQVNTTKSPATRMEQTSENGQVCYTHVTCETISWWQCFQDSYGYLWDCTFSHYENKCEGVTVCYDTGGPPKTKAQNCQECRSKADGKYNPGLNRLKWYLGSELLACQGASFLTGVKVYTDTELIELLSPVTEGGASAVHAAIAVLAGFGFDIFCTGGVIFNYLADRGDLENEYYKDKRDCNTSFGCEF